MLMISLTIKNKLREAVREKRTLKESRGIFIIDDVTVAKRYWKKKRPQTDFKYGRLLHTNGVLVPRYYGIVKPDNRLVRNFYDYPLYHWYLVMERINGIAFKDIKEGDMELFTSLHRSQIDKALALEIRPKKLIDFNESMFNREKGLVYLVNFGSWQNGVVGNPEFSRENLDILYSQIRSEPGGI